MPDVPRPADALPPRRTFLTLLIAVATILFIGLTLRVPTISMSPLIPDMKADTGHGETFLSLLTSIPLALTLAAAPVAPVLANRFGRNFTAGFSLFAVVIGMGVRSIPGEVPLLIGTAILGFFIAICTVLVPSIIAAERSEVRARLTGTYSMSLSLGPALALAMTIPIRNITGFDWRGTLLVWASCAAIALILWVLYARSAPADAEPDPATAAAGAAKSVLRDSGVWLLALYLGVTSLTFYATSAWLPTLFVMDGMSETAAGGFASLVSFVAIPFGLIAPLILRGRLSHVIAPAAPVLAIIGLIILLTAGASAAVLITVLLGVSQGLCVGAAYDQIVNYGRTPAHTASVSAVTSAVGVALAAIGPLAFGFGLETAGSPVVPVIGLGLVVAAQSVIGLRTSRF